ncbi:Hypothetical protein DEACI_4138 [Acididesulfobacillus acetoxydans]|uniref:Uncharacterized protein n=1 Tax=Acididesulfobacillus acetoxydans TaxID=1561005 RepID=A0A8S0Y4V8_9FIRM|nr:hypothetical protein [Acididesulfobacillus acetoxydans]CAA7603315.1 Hypothetical protein DEACI_4138 [Acididesulfobacillus acetoxydans]CEJ09661.1 Hypothetical protein DEACI_4146 [Acididesulfobacillus acetoxydans]
MPEPSIPEESSEKRLLEKFLVSTGFYDLLPLALEVARRFGYDPSEMIEAVCKVSDKFSQYLPVQNRTAWFQKVFEEKLREAKGDILTFNAQQRFSASRKTPKDLTD